MMPHELMVRTNHYLIKGGELTAAQKTNITGQLLAAKSTPEQSQRRFTKIKGGERDMYPYLYVLPYNGGVKLNTIFNQEPKTQILSMNNYELEIVRLLYLFEPNNQTLNDMVDQILERLKKTCFGNLGCGTGECFDAGLITLRFLAATVPDNTNWISNLIKCYNDTASKRKHSKYYGPHYTKYYAWYYWLCLGELPYEIAESEIIKHKEEILSSAKTGLAMTTEANKILNPVRMSALKNCISRLSEYEKIKECQPYISDKDGRLRLDII